MKENSSLEFISACEAVCDNVNVYDNLSENDPALECWSRFASIDTEAEKRCVAMNLLTALKWFRNKELKEELKHRAREEAHLKEE